MQVIRVCPECSASVREGERHYMGLPLPDIIDRYTITKLKIDRFSPEQKIREPLLEKEFETYEFAVTRIRQDFPQVDRWVSDLYEINNTMWDLEWSITACVENGTSPEKIGTIALMLRTENNKRAKVRNVIVHETGHGFFDHKIGHASETKGDVFLAPRLPEDFTFQTAAGNFTLSQDKDEKIAQLLSRGSYSQDTLLAVANMYARDGVAIDVGAHVGTVSIPLARVARKVIAFEANPATFKYLYRNVVLNAVNIDIRNKGLSDTSGRASVVVVNAHNAGAATLGAGDDIEMSTLDKEVERADFLKLDIEGMELAALRGGERLVSRSRPVVWFEVNLTQLRAHTTTIASLDAWFRDRNYELFLPIESGSGPTFGCIQNLAIITFLITPRAYLLRGPCAPFNVLAIPRETTMHFPVCSYAQTIRHLIRMHLMQKFRRLMRHVGGGRK